jgi:hypothetical protein
VASVSVAEGDQVAFNSVMFTLVEEEEDTIDQVD